MVLPVIFGIFLMGLSGLLAETIIIRELLIVFSGNELSIGIIIANWLIFESLGSLFAVKRKENLNFSHEKFSLFNIFFVFSLFYSIFLSRNLKNFLGLSIGETVGIFPFFYSSILIIFPTSFTHGALFTISCEIYSKYGKNLFLIGKVYLIETLGSIFAGIISTYFLFPNFNNFEIASYIAFLNFIVCLFLTLNRWKKNYFSKILTLFLFFMVFLTTFFIVNKGFQKIHIISIKNQWKNQNLVHYQNSKYGNISIVENEGQYIFFLNGDPSLIVPVPEIGFLEEFIHLPLLFHKKPEKILLIGIGAGGAINEILKHSTIKNIEYIEIDPILLNLIESLKIPLIERELKDKRVKIKNIDGRFYLKKTKNFYDLIILGITEPYNLESNRFFTLEFFEIIKGHLERDGIFVFCLPGSLRFYNEELKNLNSCIYNTLKKTFSYVRVFPGEGKNIFLSSGSEYILKKDKEKIIERLIERNIKANVLLPWHVESKMHIGWKKYFYDFIKDGSKKLNTDFKPIGVFYNLSYYISIYEPFLLNFYKFFEKISFFYIFLFFFLFFLFYIYLKFKSFIFSKISIPFVITTSGFAGMVFDLAIVFAFQCVYGYIFSWIGFLISFFMFGTAFGAFFIMRIIKRFKTLKKILIFLDSLIIFLCLVIPFSFFLLNKFYLFYISPFSIFLFLIFSFLSGFLLGAQFPLASEIYLKQKASLTKTAGTLYACDLIGGFLGGFIFSIFLFPALGLFGASLFVFLIKTLSFIVLIKES